MSNDSKREREITRVRDFGKEVLKLAPKAKYVIDALGFMADEPITFMPCGDKRFHNGIYFDNGYMMIREDIAGSAVYIKLRRKESSLSMGDYSVRIDPNTRARLWAILNDPNCPPRSAASVWEEDIPRDEWGPDNFEVFRG